MASCAGSLTGIVKALSLLLKMKRKMLLGLVSLLLLLAGYGLGYWSGFSHARQRPQVFVAIDASDITPLMVSSMQGFYDPYFTKKNSIPPNPR